MVAAQALSEQDVEAARAQLSGGRAVTVWFTPAAVGVPAGGSVKIVSIGEVAEGDFIQVRPTGSRDTMFCSPGELTRTRPSRKPAPAAEPPAAKPLAAAPVRKAPVRAAPAPVAPAPVVAEVVEKVAEEARPRAGGRAAVRPPAEVTVTMSATGEGDWTVEVMVGRKRTVRPTPVQPGDVAVAARALPPAVAEAISSSLDAARRRRAEQVERLRAELEAAERALKELNG